MIATSLLWASSSETLLPERKKPFRLAKANPISAALILFNNGKGALHPCTPVPLLVQTDCVGLNGTLRWSGLRRLAIGAALFNSCNPACWNFRQGLRTHDDPRWNMGWTAATSSYFDTVNALWNMCSAKFVVRAPRPRPRASPFPLPTLTRRDLPPRN